MIYIQIQQYSFVLSPQTSSKTIHTLVPSQKQGISMRMDRVMRRLKAVHTDIGHQKSSLKNMAREECVWHKLILWGAHILMSLQKEHAKLCAPFVAFYTLCMDVQTHGIKHHQPYSWAIGSRRSAIANAIRALCISFLAPWHAFLWIMSLHSS